MTTITCEPTYIFQKPFCFMGKELKNSVELLKEFMDHWDIALSVFKRGDMSDFWSETVGMTAGNDCLYREEEFRMICDRMWLLEKNVNEDVLFQKVFYLIEPKADLIPVAWPGSTQMHFMNRVDFLEYIQNIFLMGDADLFVEILGGNLSYNPKWNDSYDNMFEKLLFICQMFRERSFYCWDLYFIQKRYENPKIVDHIETMQRKKFKTDRDYYVAFKSVLWDAARKRKYEIQKQWAFIHNNKICYTEREFYTTWTSEINKMSLKAFSDFVNALVCNKGNNNFEDFILGCKKTEVHKKFCAFAESWKNRPDVSFEFLDMKNYPELTEYGREKKWRCLKERGGREVIKECLSQMDKKMKKLDEDIKLYTEQYELYERIFSILYEINYSIVKEDLYKDAVALTYIRSKIEKREKVYAELKKFYDDLSYTLKYMKEADFEGIWEHTFYEDNHVVSNQLVKLFIFYALCADFDDNHKGNRIKFKEFFEKNKKDMSAGWRVAIKEKVTF